MKSRIPLRHRGVLCGTAMAACVFSGFLLMMSKIPVPRVAKGFPRPRWDMAHSNPAAFRRVCCSATAG